MFDRLDEVYIVGGMGEVKLKYLGDDMVLLNGIKKEEVTQGTRVEDQEWSRNFKWGRAQDLQCLVLIEMMLIKRLKEKEKECSKGGPGEVGCTSRQNDVRGYFYKMFISHVCF